METTHQARQAVFQRFKEHELAPHDQGACFAGPAEGRTLC
jgi:hypothetical protein